MIDPEALVCAWLTGRLGGPKAVGDLPANLESSVPIVWVTSLGGSKTNQPWNWHKPLTRNPRLDLDFFALTMDGAKDLGELTAEHLLELKNNGNQFGFVTAIDLGELARRPDFNTNIRRTGMTAVLTIRAE